MKLPFSEEVLCQLREMRSDITRQHGFDFYLYLPSESAANEAAKKVRTREFLAEVVPGTTGSNWLCRVSTRLIPEVAPLDEIGTYFQQVAAELHGEFDGWESDIIQ